MKAMILAAGFGTRLGALTQTTPKCLVEVGGKSMLEHVVDRLRKAGVDSLVINLHHLGDVIERYVRERGGFGMKVEFSREPEILGTGGGIKAARSLLEGEDYFFVHNGDVYSEIDLAALHTACRSRDAIATLAVMSRPTSRALVFDDQLELVGWENAEKRGADGSTVQEAAGDLIRPVAQPQRLAFSGIHVLSKRIFDYMEDEQGAFSIIRVYMNAARYGERVIAHVNRDSFWIDMGTPKHLDELRARLGRPAAL